MLRLQERRTLAARKTCPAALKTCLAARKTCPAALKTCLAATKTCPAALKTCRLQERRVALFLTKYSNKKGSQHYVSKGKVTKWLQQRRVRLHTRKRMALISLRFLKESDTYCFCGLYFSGDSHHEQSMLIGKK